MPCVSVFFGCKRERGRAELDRKTRQPGAQLSLPKSSTAVEIAAL